MLWPQFNTKYYYAVGIGVGHTSRTFWFTTPPKVGPDVPYTFGVIGKLFFTVLTSVVFDYVQMLHVELVYKETLKTMCLVGVVNE